jgi:hypothetical protein
MHLSYEEKSITETEPTEPTDATAYRPNSVCIIALLLLLILCLELKVQAARLWKDLIRKSRSSINGSNLCHHRYHRRRLSPLFGDLGWI